MNPVLRIFDEAKAKEFYIEFLGFSLDWEHRYEIVMRRERSDSTEVAMLDRSILRV